MIGKLKAKALFVPSFLFRKLNKNYIIGHIITSWFCQSRMKTEVSSVGQFPIVYVAYTEILERLERGNGNDENPGEP